MDGSALSSDPGDEMPQAKRVRSEIETHEGEPVKIVPSQRIPNNCGFGVHW